LVTLCLFTIASLLRAGIVQSYASKIQKKINFFTSAICQVTLCLFTIASYCDDY